ncbi:transmembrane protein [Cystoisospora suis]|uniref:Transmembrane protein n=1 Tax=Cystoisospora suis TaxID=483139 RepID=A0A2C6L8E8_9APIC|nr:transmembrane protein [Cystoisospora suis]
MALRAARLLFGAAPSLPTPPAGTGVMLHGRLLPVKYALNGPKWIAVISSAIGGLFSGHFFYKHFVMMKNPPNPPRDPNDQPPAKHPHAPADSD